MNKDIHPSRQEDLRHSLNNILKDNEGGVGSITSEPGNELCFPLSGRPIGSINVGEVSYIFSYNSGNGDIEIGSATNCTYNTILTTSCFGYDETSIVKGVSFDNRDCERILVFSDGVNEDVLLNINTLSEYYTEDYADYLTGGGDPNDYILEKFNCNKFLFTPNYTNAYIDNVDILQTGGSLYLGSYWFALQYLAEDGSPTDYFYISNKCVVTPDSETETSLIINGGYNESYNWNEEVGGLPKTNKSIRLNINNIDTSFAKLRISVIRANTGDGVTKEAYRVRDIDITSSTHNVLYSGQEIVQIPLEEIQIPPVSYKSSESIALMGKRLLRANVKEDKRDFGKLQATSNAINVSSDINTITGPSFETQITSGDQRLYRGSTGTYSQMGFMADSVVALGIRYKFKDGTWSPVCHIPGREARDDAGFVATGNAFTTSTNHPRPQITGTVWDRAPLTVTATPTGTNDVHENNVEHLGLSLDSTVEMWRVFNTSAGTVLGYHECDNARYPEERDCDGNLIYPYTGTNENPVMDKIRHHRLPDRASYSLNSTGISDYRYRIINLTITNVIYPVEYQNDIEGWEIVMAKEDDTNKTIVAKGILERTVHGVRHFGETVDNEYLDDDADKTVITQSPLYNQNPGSFKGFLLAGDSTPALDLTGVTNVQNEHYSFYSPEITLNKVDIRGCYIQTERFYTGTPTIHEHAHRHNYKAIGITNDTWYINSLNLRDTLEGVDSQYFLRPIDKVTEVRFMDTVPQGSDPSYSSIANQDNVFLKVANYSIINSSGASNPGSPLANTINTTGESWTIADSEGSAVGNNLVRYTYVSIKKVIADAYSDLQNLEYMQIDPVFKTGSSASVTGGNCFMDVYGVRKTWSYGDKVWDRVALTDLSWYSSLPIGGIFQLLKGRKDYQRTHHGHILFPVESYVNIGLRHDGLLIAPGYIEEVNGNPDDFEPDQYVNVNSFWPATYGVSEEGLKDYLSIPTNYLNYYSLNKDYSLLNDVRTYNPIQLECGNCNNEYIDRIVWSDISQPKTTLALNAVDIGTNRGEIKEIVPFKNTLLVRTEMSLFMIAANYQEIQTTEATVFTGTGAFLGTPPQEILEVDKGFMSCKSRLHTITTEQGVAMLDEVGKRIFLYNGQLQNISGKGMLNWFTENLTFKLPNYQSFRSYNTIATNVPVGLQLSYDPVQHRLFVTKHDYVQNSGAILDESNLLRGDVSNNSFNLSYDLELGMWDSFHSYIPRYSFNSTNYYTLPLDSSTVYIHKKSSPVLRFYGNTHYDVKEFVVINERETATEAIYLIADFFEYNNTTKAWYRTDAMGEVTSYIWARNSQQSTGLLELRDAELIGPYTSKITDVTALNHHKNGYSISRFRDRSSDGPYITMDREQIENLAITRIDDYSGYDDIIPYNTGNPNYSVSRLRDRFLIVRIYYRPQSPSVEPIYKNQKFSLYLGTSIQGTTVT